MKVLLQLPLRDHQQVVRIFTREVELPAIFPGLYLRGYNLPKVFDGGHAATRIVEVAYDLDAERIYAVVYGMEELTYDVAELQSKLGDGWIYDEHASRIPTGDCSDIVD